MRARSCFRWATSRSSAFHDNEIRNMGQSGIATLEFFNSTYAYGDTPAPVFIVAVNIDISRNLIENNVRNTKIAAVFSQNFDNCVGGVCLAASVNAVIRENRILNNTNGKHRVPTCGVGLVAAHCATIEDNQIIGNATEKKFAGILKTPAGLRGGIVGERGDAAADDFGGPPHVQGRGLARAGSAGSDYGLQRLEPRLGADRARESGPTAARACALGSGGHLGRSR